MDASWSACTLQLFTRPLLPSVFYSTDLTYLAPEGTAVRDQTPFLYNNLRTKKGKQRKERGKRREGGKKKKGRQEEGLPL